MSNQIGRRWKTLSRATRKRQSFTAIVIVSQDTLGSSVHLPQKQLSPQVPQALNVSHCLPLTQTFLSNCSARRRNWLGLESWQIHEIVLSLTNCMACSFKSQHSHQLETFPPGGERWTVNLVWSIGGKQKVTSSEEQNLKDSRGHWCNYYFFVLP